MTREFGNKPPMLHRIEKNFKEFTSDPGYKDGIKKLDRVRLHDSFESLKENYATFINFYVYRRYMKAQKSRRGKLSDRAESVLLERGHQALDAYRDMLVSLKEIDRMLESSGVGKAIDRHAALVFQNLNHNPKLPAMVDEFRSMGVPEDAIAWLYDRMREAKYDILRIEGIGGSFSSLVKRAESLVPALEKSVAIQKEHGLPIIEGAGDDKDEYVEAGVAVGVAIIFGLIFGFCYDWRSMSLPHVLHWDS